MRIVLDTNVLARAASGPPGPAAELLLRCVSVPNLLCLSPYLLSELSRVLRYPRVRKIHGMPDEEIDGFVRDVQMASLVVTLAAENAEPVVAADPGDDPIVATAVAAKSQVLCTRDHHLRGEPVVRYCAARGIEVLTDLELLERLRQISP